ncbi:DUF1592 domain-containing protein [Schlesneria sp. T3-172]|uniref:DUF1592 domain-containing protein n=1 Tax=Schlesneria sphaerica TaxID=3373610 RepID=UPI0037C8F08C
MPVKITRTCIASLFLSFLALGVICLGWSDLATGDDKSGDATTVVSNEDVLFREQVQPLLQKYCYRCHDAETMKSGVRVDHLTGGVEDRQIPFWLAIRKLIDDQEMPPADEPQLSDTERRSVSKWIDAAVSAARARDIAKNGSIRRLTVSQYRNTLKDLLGLQEDLTDSLPPDGISKEGFTNQSHTMVLSPLQVETYFEIAQKGLDLCIVDENRPPVIQNFRMDLGAAINPSPCPDNLVLGANSDLLNNADFTVTELTPAKPFVFEPFAMRTTFDFIEGYVGNDTIREWRKFDSIYHAVFACVRGTPGYPKGRAHQAVPEGLLLRPAIPSPEIFGQSNTYGPMANFKISLRELPDSGNFRLTVRAARYRDALLLDAGSPVEPAGTSAVTADVSMSPETTIVIPEPGVYQLDVYCAPGGSAGELQLQFGDRQVAGHLDERKIDLKGDGNADEVAAAFLLARLPAGELKINARYRDPARLKRLVWNRLDDQGERTRRFSQFENRSPSLGVYLGLRRDCGSTLTSVGAPQRVQSDELQTYVFEGAINDFPSPDVEKDNVNYLAGIREIGVRSEYTDGRDMPRLLVKSIEFEGPYFESWPPATHQRIFSSVNTLDPPMDQARGVIRSFATKAFRRPVTHAEEAAILNVWQGSFDATGDARQSIKDALTIVLTSPQFLFLIENSASPEPEDLDPYELASKLSYFLWNTAPDAELLERAADGTLPGLLDDQLDRMIRDPRFEQFLSEFVSQWLSLDKLDVVAVDSQQFPRLTRDVKTHLRQEPVRFVAYLIENNLPLRQLVKSDFIVANEVVASYYGLGGSTESGFQFVPVPHGRTDLGGVLTNAGILAGLSNGRESNPIKRGAWVARKIISEPPADPPPNVPQLPEDEGSPLTLREKLERHRNQQGCAKCHEGIDPWGFPFEQFDAAGLLKSSGKSDPRSTLPDGTEVSDLNGLKDYFATDRIDQIAFGFMRHLACYAVGRSLTYNETESIREHGKKLRSNDYRMHDMIRLIVKSDLFLKK